MNNTLIGTLFSGKGYPNDGIRALYASILSQAWDDAYKIAGNSGSKSYRTLNTKLSRSFLTGNYSREMLWFYCTALDLDPNRVIRMAMKQKWAKDFKPRYFTDEK